MKYKAVQKIKRMIGWREIAQKYNVKPSFNKVIRHLMNKGYVDLHGKSGDVASLSKLGVEYVLGTRASGQEIHSITFLSDNKTPES